MATVKRNDAVSIVVIATSRGEHAIQQAIIMKTNSPSSSHGLHDRLPGGCIQGKERDYADAAVRHLIRKTGMNVNPERLILLPYRIATNRGGTHFFYACRYEGVYRIPVERLKKNEERTPIWTSLADLLNARFTPKLDPAHREAVKDAWIYYDNMFPHRKIGNQALAAR